MSIANCYHCKNREIIKDPDPDDWFCDDDIAVVCTVTPNDKQNTRSRYMADHSQFKPITVACRPYNVEKECETPKWCPLLKK